MYVYIYNSKQTVSPSHNLRGKNASEEKNCCISKMAPAKNPELEHHHHIQFHVIPRTPILRWVIPPLGEYSQVILSLVDTVASQLILL